MCLHAYVYTWLCQENSEESIFLSTMWALRIKFRTAGMAVSALTDLAVSPGLKFKVSFCTYLLLIHLPLLFTYCVSLRLRGRTHDVKRLGNNLLDAALSFILFGDQTEIIRPCSKCLYQLIPLLGQEGVLDVKVSFTEMGARRSGKTVGYHS